MANEAKKLRGRALENTGGEDIFGTLLAEFVEETKPKSRRKLGLALLPYIMPRLRSVDITSKVDVAVTVQIGGLEVGDPNLIGLTPEAPAQVATQLGNGVGAVIDQVVNPEDVIDA